MLTIIRNDIYAKFACEVSGVKITFNDGEVILMGISNNMNVPLFKSTDCNETEGVFDNCVQAIMDGQKFIQLPQPINVKTTPPKPDKVEQNKLPAYKIQPDYVMDMEDLEKNYINMTPKKEIYGTDNKTRYMPPQNFTGESWDKIEENNIYTFDTNF